MNDYMSRFQEWDFLTVTVSTSCFLPGTSLAVQITSYQALTTLPLFFLDGLHPQYPHRVTDHNFFMNLHMPLIIAYMYSKAVCKQALHKASSHLLL